MHCMAGAKSLMPGFPLILRIRGKCPEYERHVSRYLKRWNSSLVSPQSRARYRYRAAMEE